MWRDTHETRRIFKRNKSGTQTCFRPTRNQAIALQLPLLQSLLEPQYFWVSLTIFSPAHRKVLI